VIHLTADGGIAFVPHYRQLRSEAPTNYLLIDTSTGQESTVDFPSDYGWGGGLTTTDGVLYSSVDRSAYSATYRICDLENSENQRFRTHWGDANTHIEGHIESNEIGKFLIAPITPRLPDTRPKLDGFLVGEDGRLTAHKFDWFTNENYDMGYQGLVDAATHPITGELLISVQRAGHIVVCDPVTGERLRIIDLAGEYGNARICFDLSNNLWTMDRDVLVCIDMHTERPRHTLQIVNDRPYVRPDPGGSAPFIAGNLFIDEPNNAVWVTRPYDGDVLAFDMTSMQEVHRINTGGDPIDIAVAGNFIFTREWPTWELRKHAL